MTDDRDAPLETLHEGRWLRLMKRGRWEFAERVHGHGMAVIIIAATPEDEVLFVEQFRVPLGRPTIEMPAGLVGDEYDDDTLAGAARRELIEETGYEAAHVEVLLTGPTSSGMTTTGVPVILSDSRPARASSVSRTVSASSRRTDIRPSNRFSGSTASSSLVRCDDCR